MKVLFLGDYKQNTGPSNVNKELKKFLSQDFMFIHLENRILKSIEIILKSFFSNKIIISGFSKYNNISIKIAKLLNKEIYLIQHGSAIYENKINEFNRMNIEEQELYYFESSKQIICVSKSFMKFLQEMHPQYSKKMTYLYNGINWNDLQENNKKNSVKRIENTIITMGGGRPQKNNLVLCEAIQILNEKSTNKYRLLVLGRDYIDTEKIKEFEFVEYIGQVSHETACSYLGDSKIFIQNSYFEPFGLAPIEALLSGCDILLSKHIGSIDILHNITDHEIIEDCFNPFEIATKIDYVSKNKNNKRILNGLNVENTSYEFRATQLKEIINK